MRHTRSRRNQEREEGEAQGTHFPFFTAKFPDSSSSEQITGEVMLLLLTFSGETRQRDYGAIDFEAIQTSGNLVGPRFNPEPSLTVFRTREPSTKYNPHLANLHRAVRTRTLKGTGALRLYTMEGAGGRFATTYHNGCAL